MNKTIGQNFTKLQFRIIAKDVGERSHCSTTGNGKGTSSQSPWSHTTPTGSAASTINTETSAILLLLSLPHYLHLLPLLPLKVPKKQRLRPSNEVKRLDYKCKKAGNRALKIAGEVRRKRDRAAKGRGECDVGRKARTRMSLATRRFRISPASAVSAVAAMLPRLSEARLEGHCIW